MTKIYPALRSKIITILSVLLLVCNSCYANHIAIGRNGMVVTGQHLATQVGMDILKQGGNAVDAAAAVGYALAVVHPCCGNLGGGGFMLIHLAKGENSVVNFRETAPSAINPQLFFNEQGVPIQNKSRMGYLAVGIPGTVAGLNTALAKYGTLPLKTVMQPAIDLANNGYILRAQDANLLANDSNFFTAQTNVAEIFLPHDKPLQSGQTLIQKNLAKTLEIISTEGTKGFYQGNIASEIVNASKTNGGVIQLQDLATYHAEQQTPITCNYRGYQIITIPPPGSGVTVCELLNITSGYPLSLLGYHSTSASHFIIEAMRYVFADRNTYLGDPDFIQMPLTKLLSSEYASKIRQQISPVQAGHSKQLMSFMHNPENQNTTSYAIADKYGNVVVVTYTLNGYFGAKVIASDTGFFLNNELDDFTVKSGTANLYGLVQSNANLIAPKKRPLSSIAPVIITKNGKFVMAIATPGGSTIPTQTVEAIENMIDYDMKIGAAINAPRFHMQWFPDVVYTEPSAFNLLTLIQLKMMGYHFKLGSPYDTLQWGAMVGIFYDARAHLFTGAGDVRTSDSTALGY